MSDPPQSPDLTPSDFLRLLYAEIRYWLPLFGTEEAGKAFRSQILSKDTSQYLFCKISCNRK